jgi:hypothetical protein
MEIIKAGKPVPPKPVDWWIGQEVTCSTCGLTGRLQISDPVLHKVVGNTRFVVLPCPTAGCGYYLQASTLP